MTDSRRSPAVFLPVAHRLAEVSPSLPSHVVDQVKAASAESQAAFERVSAFVCASGDSKADLTPEAQAFFMAALAAAWGIAPNRWCRHVRDNRLAPQPLWIELSARRVGCLDCAARNRLAVPRIIDGCDVCGAEVATFSPVYGRFGLVHLDASICDECRAFLPDGALMRSDVREALTEPGA